MHKLSCVSEIHTLPPEVGQIRPLQYVVLCIWNTSTLKIGVRDLALYSEKQKHTYLIFFAVFTRRIDLNSHWILQNVNDYFTLKYTIVKFGRFSNQDMGNINGVPEENEYLGQL